jgi:uncharacterized protein (TIGR00725 family)
MPTLPSNGRVRKTAVAVCGTGQTDPQATAAARQVGRLLAEAGCTLICGGMFGVMEAACAGAQEARSRGAGGLVLGILPGGDLDGGNCHCDAVVATGMGYARNALVVLSADAVILIGGGAGTLSEAAYAWQFGKPVIGLSSSGGWAARLAGEALDDRRSDRVLEARSAEEAVAAALSAVRRR